MAIFDTPYDTSVAIGYNTKDIEFHLTEALIKNQLKLIPNQGKNVFAYTQGNSPNFPHPYYLAKEKAIVLDLRHMSSSLNPNEDLEIRVKDRAEFGLLLTRGKLTKFWLENDKRMVSSIHPKLMVIYADWLASSIGKRFALDPQDHATIKSLCALYYLSLFLGENEWDNHFTANALLKINQIMKVPTVFAKEVIMDVDKPLSNIQSLCDLIKEKTGNVRLTSLTPALLLSIISSTWFGNNHGELLAVAMEHPPTFIALVNTAINETLYKRVGFTQVVQNVLKGESKNVSLRILEVLS